eukprot:m.342807 g.342807  ORF g.342807 m.342807 type:complete len:866 (+) comp21856_c0_seq1:104-2701(+)
MALVLIALLAGTSSGYDFDLAINRGTSYETAALGTYVEMSVVCKTSEIMEDCTLPEWVRVDRTDGVSDTTPYWRVADEAASFVNAPGFPVWIKPSWGPTRFFFGGAPDNRPVTVVGSGWTAPMNGTQLTQNCTPVTIYYNVTYETVDFELVVTDLAPGSVKLSIKQINASFPAPDQVRFDRFITLPAEKQSEGAAPAFQTSFFYHEESGAQEIIVTMQQSMIAYYGATPSYQGREGQCTAGGVYDGAPSYYPTALILPGPDGTVNDTLPSGFLGKVHKMIPLKSEYQFCIEQTNITVFNGGRLYVPLCRPNPAEEISKQPGFSSFVVPSWMSIYPQNNQTCVQCGYDTFVNTTIALPGGRTKYILQNSHKRWSTYNDNVPLYFVFDESKYASQNFQMFAKIHENISEADSDLGSWQQLNVVAMATPSVSLPKQLVTSITWADSSFLLDGPVATAHGLSFLSTYKKLGFNTVPLVSARLGTSQPSFYPGNRTGPAYQSLLFGPEDSSVVPTGYSRYVNKPPNASLLPSGLSPSQIQIEMMKWKNAYLFHNATKFIDVAYDGIFYQQDKMQFCLYAKTTQADWIYIDDEVYGAGWDTWRFLVTQSANAAARRLPTESDENLAYRMVNEVFQSWTECLSTVSPKTNIGWYGTPFPDALMAQNGISMQPSEYGPQHYLPALSYSLRMAKLRQAPMSAGKTRHLVPWLTACTYGQMTAAETLSSTLHSFGSGATGFSFFQADCFDDMGKILALSRAIEFVVPFEDIFIKGTPANISMGADSNVLEAASGMTYGLDSWIVLTPTMGATQVKFNLKIDAAQPNTEFQVCTLNTGQVNAIVGQGPQLSISLTLSPDTNTVVVVSTKGSACKKI